MVQAMRILSVCKENKNNDFIQKNIIIRVSLRRVFTRAPQRMRVVLLMQEPISLIT